MCALCDPVHVVQGGFRRSAAGIMFGEESARGDGMERTLKLVGDLGGDLSDGCQLIVRAVRVLGGCR